MDVFCNIQRTGRNWYQGRTAIRLWGLYQSIEKMEHLTQALLSLLPSKQRESGIQRENSQTHPSWKQWPMNWKAGQPQSRQSTLGPPKYTMPANRNFTCCRTLQKTNQRSPTNTQPQTTTEWQEITDKREEPLAKRHLVQKVPQPELKELPPLQVGDFVQIQNQYGNRPTKWNNIGFVTEVLPHRQYRIMLDGSWRATLRNRRFLKKIFPVCHQMKQILLDPYTHQPRRYLQRIWTRIQKHRYNQQHHLQNW